MPRRVALDAGARRAAGPARRGEDARCARSPSRPRGDRLALVAFAGEARGSLPLTQDLEAFVGARRRGRSDLGRARRHRLGAALDGALACARKAPRGEHASIVLLTDGEDLGGRGLRAAERVPGADVRVHCRRVRFDAAGSKIAVEDAEDRRSCAIAPASKSCRRSTRERCAGIAETTGGELVEATAVAEAAWRGSTTADPRLRAEDARSSRGEPRPAEPVPVAARVLAFALWFLALVLFRSEAIVRAAAVVAILLVVAGCGGESAATLHDRSVAAPRAGTIVEAETVAERAAARGGPEFQPLADFVRGNAAFARSGAEELAAMGPRRRRGDRRRDRARRAARWASGSSPPPSRPDWPEARRNVERAQLEIDELRQKRSELEPPKLPPPRPEPDRRPTEGQARVHPDDPSPIPKTPPALAELPPDEVLGVLDRLEGKEEDKRKVRRAERRSRYGTEKDW